MSVEQIEAGLDANQELVNRFASGDVHALASLLQEVTEVPVASSAVAAAR
jgi:hypothetical protein